ncbi:hypothetical protein MBLNU230_g5284t1 [Neophaeotheca triangularis]
MASQLTQADSAATTLDRSRPGLHTRNTVIEDAPQISVRRAPPQMPQDRLNVTSPMSDDFPTPKGNPPYIPVEDAPTSPASSDTQSDISSTWSKGSSKSEFDELYDLTDSDGEELPFKLSGSVKKRVVNTKPKRYPSLVIPSPGQWPTIEKLRSGVTPLSPPAYVHLSPAVASQFRNSSKRLPSTSSTPSLDGSITSEELALSSCPSTPDIPQVEEDRGWEAPIQLHPFAEELLHHIQPREDQQQLETVLEVPEEITQEMSEVVDSGPLTSRLRIDSKNLEPAPEPEDPEDELSALSVPSPGGFFSSLDSSLARHTWSSDPAPTTSTATEFYGVPFRQPNRASTVPVSHISNAPPTSTARSFYDVPWRSKSEDVIEQHAELGSPTSERQDPLTARRVVSPKDVTEEVDEEVDEIDETYNDVLKQTAIANIDRTQLWLSMQTDYMVEISKDDEDVTDSFKDVADAVPKTPEQPSEASADYSPSKKSVRFADASANPDAKADTPPAPKRISPIHDGTFWEAWRHTNRSQRARDVFQHRQARAEAAHVQRVSCQQHHLNQLQGKYEITKTDRPAPSRPISTFLPVATEDEKAELIASAERERQALEQLGPSSWSVSASKEVHGGKLLTSPIVQTFKTRRDVRILDLSGQVHCSWAWDVALAHPSASVTTTVSSDAEAHVALSALEGPPNHTVVTAPQPWNLPFPDNHFDVISARNLYTHLRLTKTHNPTPSDADEYDLTLRECLRTLKPNGFLEFDLLDAELVHPEISCTPTSHTRALGVEFAFNLRTRGYDPAAGKTFLPRLKRAGFREIKRAWLVLPAADVVPRWTDAGKTSLNTTAAATPDATPPSREPERTIGPHGSVVDASEAAVHGSTHSVRAVTGLVGARLWEQWVLKLGLEMGKSEDRCLEGVARALEEAGRGGAGWRCLVGWARK